MKIKSACKLEPFTLLRGVFAWVLLLFLATSFQTSYRALPVCHLYLPGRKQGLLFPFKKNLALSLLQGKQFLWINCCCGAVLCLPLAGATVVHCCPWPHHCSSAPAAQPWLPHCRGKIVQGEMGTRGE